MPMATINGLEIHYREKGEGFPVVLVHGFTGNSRNWALTVPVLTRQFRTISVDLRGHGHSAKPVRPEDYTLEAMADDVYALLQHLGVRECYLAGHSMGGMVSQHIVLDHPELVRALVLVDTAAEIPAGLVNKERLAERGRLVAIAREQGMEAVFEEQLRANPLRERIETNPEFLRTWREQFLLTSKEAYIYGAHGMASRKSLLGELHRISVATLVICGENDEPFLEASRKMHAEVPGSRLEIIVGAGHSPQIETPAAFNTLIVEFLSKVHETAAA
jgi:2-succinyl-6-hydroxy-2,4-cyclohexadiene-1-carboxylate synthase